MPPRTVLALGFCAALIACNTPNSSNSSPSVPPASPAVTASAPSDASTPTSPATSSVTVNLKPNNPVGGTTAETTSSPQPTVATSTTQTTPSVTASRASTSSGTVSGAPPGCLAPPAALNVAPPPLPKVITGRVGLYVALFPKGSSAFAPSKVIALNQTGQFPLASNFKQAVLFEVLRQADAGSLKLSEKFRVTRGNQSLGWYPYDGSDVIELAKRMIQYSDNTATDLLFRRVGLGSLHPNTQALGLCHTRLILPTKTWWAAQAGFGGSEWPKYALARAAKRFASAPFEQQLEMAQRLDKNAQLVSVDQLNSALKPYWDGRNGGRIGMAEIDRNLQNASTPLEWARLIHHAFLGGGLSSANQQRFREIMGLGTGRYLLKVPFVSYGGKSGNTARLLTHSGMIQTRSGDRLIYVYMNDASETLATRDQTPVVFRYISDALKKLMRPSDLVPLKPQKPAPKDPRELEDAAPKTQNARP